MAQYVLRDKSNPSQLARALVEGGQTILSLQDVYPIFTSPLLSTMRMLISGLDSDKVGIPRQLALIDWEVIDLETLTVVDVEKYPSYVLSPASLTTYDKIPGTKAFWTTDLESAHKIPKAERVYINGYYCEVVGVFPNGQADAVKVVFQPLSK